MSSVEEIKERWKHFLAHEWSAADRRDRVTGEGVRAFAPAMKNILCIVLHDAGGPGVSIIVAAVPETAPLVHEAIVHAPSDIRYLLELVEHGNHTPDRDSSTP